jgi:enediyne biosynthesis protein E4
MSRVRSAGIFSRRQFLKHSAFLGGALALPKLAFAKDDALKSTPLFQEIPASSSGINWVHTAGKSAEKYLPETSGAGCAFLDYDNDGWMDIYLVNSGKCDFYDPPQGLRNALYRNNRDGTFTDVTLKAGVAGGGYGMAATFCSITTATGHLPTLRIEPA